MYSQYSVRFKGKEVENPVLKTCVIIYALTVLAIAFLAIPIILISMFGIFVGILIFAALLTIPHYILRMIGRQGFFNITRNQTTGSVSYGFIFSLRDSLKKIR